MVSTPTKPKPPTRSRRQRAYLLMALAEEKASVMSGLTQRIDTGYLDTHGKPVDSSGICVTMKSVRLSLVYTYWFRDEYGFYVSEQDWASIRKILTAVIDHATYTPTEPQPWQIAILERAHKDCGPLCPTHGDPRDTSMAMES